jgi:DNA-binding CsgD family transcriptional regulator
MKKGTSPRPQLTRRQSLILLYVVWGKSNKEIASRLKLSVHTVDFHRRNIRQRLKHAGGPSAETVLQNWHHYGIT